jgi:hypothetical protein
MLRTTLCVMVAVLGPPALLQLYFMSGASDTPAPTAEWVAFAVSLAVGTAAIVALPLSWPLRVVAVYVYIPVAFYGLMLFALNYVCGHYGRCL